MSEKIYSREDFKVTYTVPGFANLQRTPRTHRPWSDEEARQCARGNKDPNGTLRRPMPDGWVAFKDHPAASKSAWLFAKLSDLRSPADLLGYDTAEPDNGFENLIDERRTFEIYQLFTVLRELKIPLPPAEHQDEFVQRMRSLMRLSLETASDDDLIAVLVARWNDGISIETPDDLKSLEHRTPRRVLSALGDTRWMFAQIREYYRAAFESGKHMELTINFSPVGDVTINNKSAKAGVIDHDRIRTDGIGPTMRDLVFSIWDSLVRAERMSKRLMENGASQNKANQLKADLLHMHLDEPVLEGGRSNPVFMHAFRDELRRRCLYCLEPLKVAKGNKNCCTNTEVSVGRRKHGADMRRWIANLPANDELHQAAFERRWSVVGENLRNPIP